MKQIILLAFFVTLPQTASFVFRGSRPTSPNRLSSSSTSSLDGTQNLPPRLVILIPAYNEELRIESTLECYQDFLLRSTTEEDTALFREPEIVVVDDGSQDATIKVIEDFPAKIPIRAVALAENSGKGGALAKGIEDIFEATSSNQDARQNTYILTQDADGSGDLVYLEGMLNKLRGLASEGADSKGMVVGNRNYELFTNRGITRWGFQTCVRIITSDSLRVRDSQCGYKLMTLETARLLYKNLYLKGWAHDVEVLLRASILNIPIDETPIEWEDAYGSKITETGVVKVSLSMLWGVIRLRWNYSVAKSWKLDV